MSGTVLGKKGEKWCQALFCGAEKRCQALNLGGEAKKRCQALFCSTDKRVSGTEFEGEAQNWKFGVRHCFAAAGQIKRCQAPFGRKRCQAPFGGRGERVSGTVFFPHRFRVSGTEFEVLKRGIRHLKYSAQDSWAFILLTGFSIICSSFEHSMVIIRLFPFSETSLSES